MNSSPRASTATGSATVGGVLASRYRLVTRVGAGGMATIFRGRDQSLERDVAVKVLHAHLADDPSLLERFRTEARHAAQLLHPHIVNVFDQGVADLPFIVMEYVDGPSLREVLLERGRLAPGEVLAVVEPVCLALTRAHAAGVIHRDVKPENVLVATDGTVKVADFGIARAVAATSHTTTGTLIGSVHYLAPELVDGREATPASDQYAVGIMLYELLTGRKPLPGDSPMAIALRHAREDVPPPSAVARDVPPALDAVVARATARDPDDRYPSLAALGAALRDAVPDGPVSVVLDGRGGRERTLVIPADSADTVVTPAPVRAQPPRRRRRGRRLLGTAVLALLLVAGLAAGGYAVWDQVIAPEQEVPELTGLEVGQAAAEAEQDGLLVTITEQHTLAAPAGEVIGQQPAPASILRRGGTISLTVSAGPAEVAMPGVLGMTQEEALALLEGPDYAFAVRVDESYSDVVRAGEVAGQAPDEGTPLLQTSEVIINVSRGIEQVTVPELEGATQDEAEALLRRAKLEAEFVEAYSDEQPTEGLVVSQSLEPGATVDKGTTVTVTISLGPVTFAMPDVVDDHLNDARATLEALGLEVRAIPQPQNRRGPIRLGQLGAVSYTSPEPGEPVRRGATVDVYYYAEDAGENDDD